jgi:hypothetical protein
MIRFAERHLPGSGDSGYLGPRPFVGGPATGNDNRLATQFRHVNYEQLLALVQDVPHTVHPVLVHVDKPGVFASGINAVDGSIASWFRNPAGEDQPMGIGSPRKTVDPAVLLRDLLWFAAC